MNGLVDFNRLRQLAGIEEDIKKSDIENVFFGNLKNSPERDTDIEGKLFSLITDYVENSDMADRNKIFKALQDLQKLKPYFPDDLIPKAKYAYRGTKVLPNVYERILRERRGDIRENDSFYFFNFTYKSRAKIQSWTISRAVAEDFAAGSFNYHDKVNPNLPAIIKVDINDDFIMSTKITNLINMIEFGMDKLEYEIFRISDKPIQSRVFVKPEWIITWAQKNRIEINGSQ